MTAPIRIVDLRLVLDREGRLRLSADGRELVHAGSTAEALRFIADRLERRAPAEQLSALASAIGMAVLPGAERERDTNPQNAALKTSGGAACAR